VDAAAADASIGQGLIPVSGRLRFDNGGTQESFPHGVRSDESIARRAKPQTKEEHDLRTAETAPDRSITAPDAYVARDGFRPTARRVGVLATYLAFLLAFGLLGILVGAWHLARGRRPGHPTCPGCRRRRGITLAGTTVLAGLVVAGSGMTVHQHMNGPGLPSCGPELPARTAVQPDEPGTTRAAGGMWPQARQVLTAPVSGLARHYVDDRGGGLCEGDSMTLAFMPSAASKSSFAVGSVVLTRDRSEMRERGQWKALASHESRHVTQWATLDLIGGPLAMPVLYSVDEVFYPQSRNHFERAADLDDGGYPHPEDFGPRPQWAKVGVIGVLLIGIGWRRLRWTSRVLIGGPTARTARQPGHCPLHSRGWFRPHETSRTRDLEPR
jgi:hypothetical protein